MIRLSVITIAYQSAGDCRMVVEELRRQTIHDELEVILVTPDRKGIEDHHIKGIGAWQWVFLPEVRACGEAMAAAVRVATGPIVTYAEEHSYYREDWAENLIAAYELGYDAVGFAIENANPETLTSWAHLYGQFGPVVAPVASGPSSVLAGHHASYRRDLLLEYGDLMSAMLEDEGALFLDLRKKGKRMFIAGDAISRHVNISSQKAYMQVDYLGQRSFAAARAQVGKWSLWKRLVYAGGTPLVPLVRLRRILRDIRRSGRQNELMPAILIPIGLALISGAWGEMLGYLLGSGDSAERKAPAELQRQDFLAQEDSWSKQSRA